MNFAVGFLRTIILLGAVQGFIISSLLYFSKKSKQSSRLLSKLIFLISLACLSLYLHMYGWFDSSVTMRIIDAVVPMIIIMPIGPLIFFYVKSVADPNFIMTKKERIHFYPVIIDVVPQLMAIAYLIALIFGWIKPNYKPLGRSLGSWIDDYNVYSDIPRWISVSAYLSLSTRFLAAMKLKNKMSVKGEIPNLKWLQQFIRIFLVFQVIWLVYLIPYVIPQYTDFMLSKFDWYPIYIPMAIIVYWLGIKGYMMTNNYAFAAVKKAGNIHALLPAAALDHTVVLLKNAMEVDRLYLDPALNLNMLAEHISIVPKTISAVLNQHLHKSFNEFVNEYRIEAFKEKILQPQMNHFTIAGIAFECGFNSQATFQRTFKEFTGMSPSAFLNSRESIVGSR